MLREKSIGGYFRTGISRKASARRCPSSRALKDLKDVREELSWQREQWVERPTAGVSLRNGTAASGGESGRADHAGPEQGRGERFFPKEGCPEVR